MEIHRTKNKDRCTITTYFFTKNKNQCLCIEHDTYWDFGEYSSSGTSNIKVEIHYQNSWVKDELEQITMADVPKRIKDVLTYLK
jgi:hypothetical protein